jgi:hypothetical protein
MDINHQLNCAEAKQWDLVQFLSQLGYEPTKINRNDYWYLSPLRIEKTPSFKIARKLNVWFDHGTGKGGTIIDFCCQYFDCSVKDVLEKLQHNSFFHQPILRPKYVPAEEISPLQVLRVGPLKSFTLLRYLHSRNITLDGAAKFIKEVDFSLYEKEHKAIGFRNDSGGYELRNNWFKGSSLPKAITTIKNKSKEAAVFEGFFDFLSYGKIFENYHLSPPDFIILNSTSFLEKTLPVLEEYKQVNLYLDLDDTGKKCTATAIKACEKIRDESALYAGYKDLNDWHRHMGKGQKLHKGHYL